MKQLWWLFGTANNQNKFAKKALSLVIEQNYLCMNKCMEEVTKDWGVRVQRAEIKDVRLPADLQRSMAAEAEAAREATAKEQVIAAEGEQWASRALKEAADVISQSPSALQLRYLQNLTHIAAEKNSTIIFPLPIELLQSNNSSIL